MIGEVSLSNLVSSLLLPVLIALIIGSRGLRVDADYMSSWAKCFGLELSPKNTPAVRHYLRWSRRSRTSGGLAGFLAPSVFFAVVKPGNDPADLGGWAFSLMIAGYLVGAFVAELILDPPRRRRDESVRGISGLAAHLPTYAVVMQRGLAATAVLLVALYPLSRPDERTSGLPGPAQIAALGVAAVMIAAAVEAFQRRLVRRSGQGSDAGVDRAIATSSLHVLAGGCIALLANITGPLFLLLLFSLDPRPGPSAWPAFAAFGLLSLSSLYFWLYFGKPGGFGVRPPRATESLPNEPINLKERGVSL